MDNSFFALELDELHQLLGPVGTSNNDLNSSRASDLFGDSPSFSVESSDGDAPGLHYPASPKRPRFDSVPSISTYLDSYAPVAEREQQQSEQADKPATKKVKDSGNVTLQRKRLRERERRDQLNTCVSELGSVLGIEGNKRDKLAVLKEALQTIKSLQLENAALKSQAPEIAAKLQTSQQKKRKIAPSTLLPIDAKLPSKKNGTCARPSQMNMLGGMVPCLVPWNAAMGAKMFGNSSMLPMAMPWMSMGGSQPRNKSVTVTRDPDSPPTLTAKLAAAPTAEDAITHSHCA